MAGVHDLNDPTVQLPPLVVVDANVVVEELAGAIGIAPHTVFGARAHDFFQRLSAANGIGVVTLAGFAEFAHVVVKLSYKTALAHYRAAPLQPYGPLSAWTALYKRDPSLLQGLGPLYARLKRAFEATGLYFLDQDELNPVTSGIGLDDELTATMCRYGLDSADALLLIEAARVPTTAIATFDPDLLRARADFDVYTWL